MASKINPYNIDGTFPVAGVSNNSQGFRDNFTNIKNNFNFARQELTDLQNKAVLKSALSGQVLDNDMSGAKLSGPQLAAWTQTYLDLGAQSGTVELDFNQSNFQKMVTANNISLVLINWPVNSTGYGVMRVWIDVTDINYEITLPTTVSIAVNDIAGYNPDTNAITFDAIGNYVFEFSSADNGTTYLITDLTRNRNSFGSTNFYYDRAVRAALLTEFGDGLSQALAIKVNQDTISTAGSYNSVGVGNLTLANVTYNIMDTGGVAGYSVTAGRGNIRANIVGPVLGNDLLGYVNVLANTGYQGSANTFQQLSSIAFFAKGSNVAYGLGGNIAFFTSNDGSRSGNTVTQVMGIEQDRSVTVYGSFRSKGARIDEGVIFKNFAVSGATDFEANANITKLIIDSTSSATIANANIILPANAVNGQMFTISTVAPITAANVFARDAVAIKYIDGNAFVAGNVSVTLNYISSVSTWYRG